MRTNALRLPLAGAVALGMLGLWLHLAQAQDTEGAFKAALAYTVKIDTAVELPMHSEDEKGSFFGAGFLVDLERGWFMTNLHVVSHSPARIRVSRRGMAAVPARRIWLDPYLDLAILQVSDRKFLNGMAAARLECGDYPTVGHPVGAFGHPWGLLWTGTRGIVSGRAGPFEPGALLTDAPINSGNSGGPLISLLTGKVVGISTAALEGEGIQNLNFALAMKHACRVLKLLEQSRDPSPPSGLLVFVSGGDEEPLTVARNYMGAQYVSLQHGDVIQEVVGEPGPVATEADFMDALRGRLSAVALAVERSNADLILKGAFPPDENLLDRKAVVASGAVFVRRRFFDSHEVNLDSIAICYVERGTSGQSAGLGASDSIESIDGQPVHELDEVFSALDQSQKKHRPALVEVKKLTGTKGRSYFSYFGVNLAVEGLRRVSVTDE